MTGVWIVVGGLGFLFLWVIFAYNSLIQLQVRGEEAWRDIDTLLRQRADLIPNLVHAHTPKEQGEADDMLKNTLKTLFAVVENYPELKANENFLALQRTLEDVEEKLSRSRRYYNAVVRDLNLRPMKRLLVLGLIFAPVLAWGEEIQDFLVQIEVGEDGLVRVTEESAVFFALARHGIIREIQYFYRLPTGEQYTLRIAVEKVLADGAPVPVRRTTEGGKLVLRIGEPGPLSARACYLYDQL